MNLVRAFFFQNQGRGDLPPSPPLTRLLLMGNVAAILPLKYKLSGKFKRFIAINRSTEMLKIVEFSKISIKTKKCKTFSKAQTANCLKKFIQSLPIPPLPPSHTHTPDMTLLRLGNNFFKEIYRNIKTFAFKVLQECSS